MENQDEYLTISASYKGKPLGDAFRAKIAYPSKTGLVNWMFKVLSLLKNSRNPVAGLTTRVVKSAFTSGALSPLGPYLPAALLNKQPFYVAGTYSGKGSSSASVLKPQSAYLPLMDMAVSNDSGTTTYPSAIYKYSWDDRRDGVALAKWRAIVKAGSNATTPMTAQRGIMAGKPGAMIVRYKRVGDKTVQSVSVSGFADIAAPAAFTVAGMVKSVDTKALSKLYDKLYSIQHDADIGETLAEYKLSLAMIGKPLQGMRDLIGIHERRCAEAIRNVERRVGRPLSRFDARDVRDVYAALASLYLEFTFGWKPLALDVIAAFKAIDKSRGAIQTVVSASYRDDSNYTDQTVGTVYNSYCKFSVRDLRTYRVTTRYRVGINPDKVEALSYMERIGFTPRKFVPTLYAVLPYSWILDYFTALNASIEACCADISFTTWAVKTVREECVIERTGNPDFAYPKQVLGTSFVDASGVPSVTSATLVKVARSVPTSLMAVPALQVPKSWKPWLNLAALGLQRKVASGSFGAAQLVNALNQKPIL